MKGSVTTRIRAKLDRIEFELQSGKIQLAAAHLETAIRDFLVAELAHYRCSLTAPARPTLLQMAHAAKKGGAFDCLWFEIFVESIHRAEVAKCPALSDMVDLRGAAGFLSAAIESAEYLDGPAQAKSKAGVNHAKVSH